MNEEMARTYLAIGHVTNDRLPDGSYTSGGTVAYAAVTARRLGWRPTVITACDSGFARMDGLADVGWHNLGSPRTTSFRNEYGPRGRRQTIDAVATPIETPRMPADSCRAAIVHLAPVARELTPSVVTRFANSFLVATVQGWIRRWPDSGAVSFDDWPEAERVLPNLKAAVLSIEDIRGDWRLAEKWAAYAPVLIVTEGDRGCTVFRRGQKERIPSRPARVVDPTGAGDIFATAFFIKFFETGDLRGSAYFANVAASMSVEQLGIHGVPTCEDIEHYIRQNLFTPFPGHSGGQTGT